MARQLAKLTALNVQRTKKPGMHADGGGLYLQVRPGVDGPTKSWIFRYKIDKKERWMGLGPYPTVTLEDARTKADAQRKLKVERQDPIQVREQSIAVAKLDAAKSVTFKAAAVAYIADNSPGWKNEKHKKQWTSSLEAYAHPTFGDLPVAGVDTALVCKALRPIWHAKAATAERVRQRIEKILEAAKNQNQRTGDNPATISTVRSILGKQRSKKLRTKHHPALPYAEVNAFITALREKDSVVARALEFTILCAARTGEVRGAKWNEFDLDNALWTVPAGRMKSGNEHRVPLCDRALAIVKSMHNLRRSDAADALVFPNDKKDKPLSDRAMLALLARMKRDDITVHGFRSTFKDWAVECSNIPNADMLSEAALAHVPGDETKASYERGDKLEMRLRLMELWGRYCTTPRASAKVTPIRAMA